MRHYSNDTVEPGYNFFLEKEISALNLFNQLKGIVKGAAFEPDLQRRCQHFGTYDLAEPGHDTQRRQGPVRFFNSAGFEIHRMDAGAAGRHLNPVRLQNQGIAVKVFKHVFAAIHPFLGQCQNDTRMPNAGVVDFCG